MNDMTEQGDVISLLGGFPKHSPNVAFGILRYDQFLLIHSNKGPIPL